MATGKSYFTIEKLATVSIEENKLSQDFLLYPNPTRESINITLNSVSTDPVELMLYDMNGSLVLHRQLTEIVSIIDLQDLPSGVYFYQITETTNRTSGRLIIQ